MKWIKASNDNKPILKEGERKRRLCARWNDLEDYRFIVEYFGDERGWGIETKDLEKLEYLDESVDPRVQPASLEQAAEKKQDIKKAADEYIVKVQMSASSIDKHRDINRRLGFEAGANHILNSIPQTTVYVAVDEKSDFMLVGTSSEKSGYVKPIVIADIIGEKDKSIDNLLAQEGKLQNQNEDLREKLDEKDKEIERLNEKVIEEGRSADESHAALVNAEKDLKQKEQEIAYRDNLIEELHGDAMVLSAHVKGLGELPESVINDCFKVYKTEKKLP